jgi:hypothetical protein
MAMTQEQVANYVVMIILGGALVIGLISMLFGKLVDLWDGFWSWWGQGVHKAIHTRPVKARDMSSRAYVPAAAPIQAERRSYAMEQPTEQMGTEDEERVPAIVAYLEQMTDDQLLDILAMVANDDGSPRFAESKVGRFIGGRLEDRIAQVRDVRGSVPPPPKPQPVLRVRDNGHERLIAKYGDKHPA